MKKLSSALILSTACLSLAMAGDFQDFLDSYNSSWVSSNYVGMKTVVTNRLALYTNDLPALIAMADYYTCIDLDMAAASNTLPQLISLRQSLNWSNDLDARYVLDEIISAIQSPSDHERVGYIYGMSSNELQQMHNEFPTNHPATLILPRFAVVQYGSAD